VKNLLAAFDRRIDALTWMSPKTKASAKAKLASLRNKIGYPDTWRDYSGLSIVRGDAVGNAERAELFDYEYRLDQLNRQPDRGQWWLDPQIVNAVNLPIQNALNFPAAILEPPFFDAKAPAASNFGAIGAVIGHEISHTFDSEGAKIDANGRLRNWWAPADLTHFQAAIAALARQYDQYKPFPDLAVRGQQTLAENVADLAGLLSAFDGYHASGKPSPDVGGFKGDQQFFIAYAQNWATKYRPAAFRATVMTNIHAPGPYRALEPRNIDAWYSAFDVKPGDRLYLPPDQRVRIW